jgi:hypothetical protein
MNRNLSPNVTKGMYGGPRGIKGGDYLRANVSKNSGGVLNHASSVNGNIDTTRKVVSKAKVKKKSK